MTLPGDLANRPERPPWIGDGNRPGNGNRPDFGNRPGQGNRPGGGNWGNWDQGFHHRPDWSNRPGVATLPAKYPRPGRPGYGMGNWIDRHPDRYARWRYWGNDIRFHWSNHYHHQGWFCGNWWNSYYHPIGGWHYHYGYHARPWSYWWTVPTFASVTNWFAWTAPAGAWSEPVYYDYGQNGNVYYQDNSVYIDGKQVASAADFAASAAALATVPPPATEEEAESAEWLPLGTFAVSTGEKDREPSRAIQLAVNKQGVVSGTYFNEDSGEAQTVLGQVDKETQRVAFRIGEHEDVVVETSIYNLTQDEAPVMVHFGTDKVEYWLLVRLDYSEDDNARRNGL